METSRQRRARISRRGKQRPLTKRNVQLAFRYMMLSKKPVSAVLQKRPSRKFALAIAVLCAMALVAMSFLAAI